MQVADILEKAADVLTPEGAWTQGKYGVFGKTPIARLYSSLCIYGAVCSVGTYEAFRWLESNCMPVGCRSLILWNDAPERTQAEVVAKLREAAALAREQGQ